MKLFVFDVDGTLVYNGGEISKENIEEIQNKLDEGNAIAIASGRPFVGIDIYLSKFVGEHRYSLGANGSIIQDSKGEVLNVNGLLLKDLFEIREKYKDIVEPYGGAIYAYDKDGNVLCFFESRWTDDEIKYNKVKINVIDEHPDMNETILKVMIAASPNVLAKLSFKEDKEKYNIVLSDPKYLEFVNKDADKSTAIETLIGLLGIDKEDVYTFGDQENDARMIKNYNGIAMGNAIELCKANAKFVTLDVKDNGIAYAIREYIDKE